MEVVILERSEVILRSNQTSTGSLGRFVCFLHLLCLSIVRSDTGGQTSQTDVKLGGLDPREVRGHSEVKPDLYRQFGQVCVFSASTVVYQ